MRLLKNCHCEARSAEAILDSSKESVPCNVKESVPLAIG